MHQMDINELNCRIATHKLWSDADVIKSFVLMICLRTTLSHIALNQCTNIRCYLVRSALHNFRTEFSRLLCRVTVCESRKVLSLYVVPRQNMCLCGDIFLFRLSRSGAFACLRYAHCIVTCLSYSRRVLHTDKK